MLLSEHPVAIVTGSSRGIGAATALCLARAGYQLCINYLADSASANALLGQLEQYGGGAIAVQADVGSEADVTRLFETVDRRLGRVTALVNNAGIAVSYTHLRAHETRR